MKNEPKRDSIKLSLIIQIYINPYRFINDLIDK